MKKSILVLSFLMILLAGPSFSQGFDKGNAILQLGVSASVYDRYYDLNRNSFLIPLFVSGEVAIHEYVSVGGMTHFFTRRWTGNAWIDGEYASDWKIRETWFSLGGRGAFLLTPFLNDRANTRIPEELHLYGGVQLGFDYYVKSKDNEYKDYSNDVEVGAFFGPYIGGRYMFTDGFGAFLETGIGWLGHGSGHAHLGTFGVAFKF